MDYGDAVLVRHADDSVTVERADPVIGVSLTLLAECADPWCFGPDGLLWLDTAGEYRYRPVRLGAHGSDVLICERAQAPGAS